MSASTVRAASSLRNQNAISAVEAAQLAAARQPKAANMKGVSQFHLAATMRTGGAAKWVSVPPMETLTKSSPSVA